MSSDHRPIGHDGGRALDCAKCGEPWPCPDSGEELVDQARVEYETLVGHAEQASIPLRSLRDALRTMSELIDALDAERAENVRLRAKLAAADELLDALAGWANEHGWPSQVLLDAARRYHDARSCLRLRSMEDPDE